MRYFEHWYVYLWNTPPKSKYCKIFPEPNPLCSSVKVGRTTMVHSHHHLLLFSTFPFSLTTHPNHHLSPSLHFLHRSSTPTSTVSAIPSAAWLSDLTPQDFGPIQLPSSLPFSDDPSTVQVASTVLLTGALTVFLFRTVQRRIKRAKQLVYCFLLLQYFCFNFLEMNRLKMSLWL